MPNIVLVGLPNVNALRRAEAKLRAAEIPHYCWNEPDAPCTGFNAITTAPVRGEQREALRNYRVYSDTPGVLMASTSASKAESTGPIPVGCANGAGAEASARV